MAVCVLLGAVSPAALAQMPEISSPRAIVGDANSDRILFALEADTKCAPASITKIMTLLLAVEAVERGDVGIDDMVTASSKCRFDLTDDSSTAHIYKGERMRFEDLLYCAALISANEACNIIAEHVAGSIPDFVERMNARANDLGCENTHFANTHGLPDEEHYTTARDLYRIAREGMRHELFRTVVGTASYDTAATNASAVRHLQNSNALINRASVYTKKYLYEGARGIKTGHTDEAGFCLVSAAERDGVSVIAVVLGGSGDMVKGKYFNNFADSITLYDWVFENFSPRQIVGAGETVGTQSMRSGDRLCEVKLCTAEELCALADNELSPDTMSGELKLYDEVIRCPVAKGTKVGELLFTDENGNYIGKVSVVTAEEPGLEEPEPTEAVPEQSVPSQLGRQQQIAMIAAAVLFLLSGIGMIGLAAKKGKSKGKKR